ncbi:Y-family DNA polymerase [Acinetobacter sp. YH12117]|uniref:Y-family DNA polymerase n=1 Tax=Acinetobacter sp. YH12117 TaxID=2601104 RepID=UPI0015D248AD|nr:Y-family DNA polymerase [Acinetobacter sp. YH12117]
MSREEIYALVDVNNCYVSCERLFNPKLNQRPVIVLSNNDGCAVARSQEAKDLGIKMGVPLFQIKDIVEQHQVQVLSSNYALYAEMSHRFHTILGQYVAPDEQEIYSIDESFLRLTAYAKRYDLNEYAQHMRTRILRWIGLPVCVGIGRTKTEAKLANYMAKKAKRFNGVCNLAQMDPKHRDYFWSLIDASEVWGVGRQHSQKLKQYGINTVLDLAQCNPHRLGKAFSVVMQRTVMELQGQSCMEFEHAPEPRKQIVASRSFGEKITALEDLKEALAKYVQYAVKRLRSEQALCGTMIVFVQSNPFNRHAPYYGKSLSIDLDEPTDSVTMLVRTALQLLESVYKQDVIYKKCGVILTDMLDKQHYIPALFADHERIRNNENLMQAYEQIQQRFGKTKIAVGSCYLPNRKWSGKRESLSRNYFSWDGMLTIDR